MSDKNLKLCRYTAGASMMLWAIGNLFLGVEINGINDIASLVFSIASVLIAVALFMSNAQYFLIGCGIGAFSYFLYMIAGISQGYDIGSVLPNVSRVAFYVLIVLALLSQKDNANLLTVAIIVAIAGAFVGTSLRMISNDYYDFFPKLGNIAYEVRTAILLVFPVAIGAFSFDNENVPPLTKRIPSVPAQKSAEKPIESITKLKELLDMGVITQEEFDAKKKQLLGL